MVRYKDVPTSFLLDTHVFLWLMEENPRITKSLINTLKDPQHTLFLSIASVWELTIKKMKNGLEIPNDFDKVLKKGGINLLPIELKHVQGLEDLPPIHNDPFDRILISQARCDGYTLISADSKMSKYDVLLIKV